MVLKLMTPSNDSPRIDALTNALNLLLQNQDLLTKRVAHLESMLQIKAEAPPVSSEISEPVSPQAQETILEQRPLPEQPPIEPPRDPNLKPGLESKVGLTLVNRIGAITLVLGVAFFFKWAVDNNCSIASSDLNIIF